MSLEERYSATRISGLALGASLWLFVSISLTFMPWPDPLLEHHRISWPWLSFDLAWFFLGVAAAILMYRALAAFQRGVDAQLWNKSSLDRLKTRLDRPAFSAAIWAVVSLVIGYLIFSLLTLRIGSTHHHPSIGGMAYFWLSPATAIATLRKALKPKRERSLRVWRDEIKPIVSDHWGDRSPAASEPAAS